MLLTLTRDQYLPECTLGILEVGPKKFFTIERPWIPDPIGKAGKKYVSCIGEGQYTIHPYTRPSGEKAFMISNPMLDVFEFPADVPKGREDTTRTLVLIHAANYVHDVIGCIGPGLDRKKVMGNGWMVADSREAMNQIRTLVGASYNLSLLIQKPLVGAGGSFGGAGATTTTF